jgi:hypothetical protein
MGSQSRLLRAAVLAYLVLLWLGAWSAARTPPRGGLPGAAREALAAVGILPGAPVFRTSPGDWKVRAICPRVVGQRRDGSAVVLYAPPCPPEGFVSHYGAFDHLVQRMIRDFHPRPLIKAGRVGLPREYPEINRRFLALGDYFCHSPLVAPPDLEQVTMRREQRLYNYADGSIVARDFVCTWRCDPERIAVPVCSWEEARELRAPLVDAGAPDHDARVALAAS